MKLCKECKESKKVSEFSSNKSMKDGLAFYCKPCYSQKLRKSREKKLAENPLWSCWSNVRYRCNSPNSRNFKDYGGRGITYCEGLFRSPESLWKILEGRYKLASKEYPGQKIEIDRIDNDRGYFFDNIRFVPKIANNNNRRNNIILENPETKEKKTLAEWVKIYNKKYITIWKRHQVESDFHKLFDLI